MKTPCLPALSFALLLTPAARAVTETWDGGGADGNVSTAANWVDNSAPISNLSLLDLFFGTVPEASAEVNFGTAFSAHSLTIKDADGFFVFYTFSGQTLSVGTGGIAHSGGKSANFTNPVSFSGVANSTIDEGSFLIFSNTVTLPTNTLTVTGGGETYFDSFAGTTTLNKSGAGTMNWSPTTAQLLNVTVSSGTLSMFADNVVDVLGNGAGIAVNGTSVFNMNDGLTLNGATLTRASGAVVNLATGKTLRVQGGGDMVMTGAYSNTTNSTITVTGAGSSFTGNSSLSFNGGSLLNVADGGTVAAGASVNLGTAGSGTAIVTGSGSSLSGGNFNVGLSGDSGLAIFSSGSTGTFDTLNVAASGTGGSDGLLSIQSGAAVTGTALVVANVAGATDGTVTITGTGSALTLTGAATATIGASSLSAGTLNVNSRGIFNSGTGVTTVRTTGTIVIDGGTYHSNGNLTLTGGRLERIIGGFVLDAGRTFTVQGGGDAIFTGAFSNDTNSDIVVTGSGSTLSTTAALSINGGSTLTASLSGDVTTATALSIGTSGGNGTVSIIDTGSAVTLSGAATATIGASGGSSGTLNVGTRATFNSGTGLTTVNATGTIAVIDTGTFFANGSVTLNGGQLTRDTAADFLLDAGRTFTVQNGGDAIFTGPYSHGTASNIVITGAGSTLSTTGNLSFNGGSTLSVSTGGVVSSGLALSIGTASGATITVAGAGAALTAESTVTIGAVSGSAATVTIANGGTFTTGTGLTTVNATGALNINAGGTLTGVSDFTGAGQINIAGACLPGTTSGPDQTTSVSFAQNMILHGTSSITMELGGLVAGTDHDQLAFHGPGTTQVTWNGTLNVVLINGFAPQAGQSFNLFDFDAARDAGAFTALNLPALTGGLSWLTDRLYTEGIIEVSSEGTYAQWKAAFGTGSFDADDDLDGIENGVEFLLGTDPTKPSVLSLHYGATTVVVFDIPASPASDAHYRLKASGDMLTWTTIASKDGAGPWTGTATVMTAEPVAGFTRVTAAEAAPPGTAHRFHRLEGEEP